MNLSARPSVRQPLTLFPAEEEERHYRKERLVVPAEEVQGFRVSGVDRSPDVGHMAHLAPTSFKREEGNEKGKDTRGLLEMMQPVVKMYI